MMTKKLNQLKPTRLRFSHNCKLLAVIDFDSYVSLWSFPEMKLIYHDNSETSLQEYSTVCFSPDDSKFVTGRFDGYITIWDTQKCCIITAVTVHDSYVNLLFSPNGKFLFVCGAYQSVYILDTANWEIKIKCILGDDDEFLSNAKFSQNSKQLYIGSSKGTLYVLDTTSGEKTKQKRVFQGQIDDITCLTDNEILLIGATISIEPCEISVVQFDFTNNTTQDLFKVLGCSGVFLDNNLLISLNERVIRVWKIDDAKCVRQFADTKDAVIVSDKRNNIISVGVRVSVYQLIDYKKFVTVAKILSKFSLAVYTTLEIINFLNANRHTSFETEQRFKRFEKVSLLAKIQTEIKFIK